MTGNLSLGNNVKILLGDSDNLQIYHDGSNSYFTGKPDSSGAVIVKAASNGGGVLITNRDGDNIFSTQSNSAHLHYDGSSKLATTSTGIDVTGNATFADDGKAIFGAGSDLQIYHDGTHSYISDVGTGYLNIKTSDRFAVQSATGETMIEADANGTAKLYYDNSLKIGTTSTGVTVTQSGTDVGLLVTGGSYNYQAKFESSDAEASIILEDSNSTNDANRIGVAGNEMRFVTNNAQAFTILSSGAKNFGTFKSENGGHNIYAVAADSGSFAARFGGSGTGASNVVHITNGYGEVGSIKIASNGTTTNYNTSSDYRLKTDVQPVTNASARIQELNPVNFEWIRSGTRTDGFLAHEAQAVVPDCVSGAHNEVKVWEDNEDLPDGVSVGDNKLDDNGNTIPLYQGIDQSKIVPLLTAALQEALTEIASLKTRVEALEA
jgi:hypothetical protein